MKNIFIDANIYLLFYYKQDGKFKQLLDSILELKQKIYIPRQVVYEVERNKLKRFSDSFDNYIHNATNIAIPTIFESLSERELNDWNLKRKKIFEQLKDSNERLAEIKKKLLDQIYQGKDEVSKKLSQLFEGAEDASSEIIEKARLRKERGNPPGKKNDPLGDQISWEQFLNSVESQCKEIWIISSDSDYYFKNDNQIYLNSLLKKELTDKCVNPEVICHDQLAVALKMYQSKNPKTKLPPSKDMNQIIKEEGLMGKAIFRKESGDEYQIPFPEIDTNGRYINYCPQCNSKKNLTLKEATMKDDGTVSMRFNCNTCGYLFTSY